MKHIRAQYGDYFGITVAGYPGLFSSSFVFVFFCLILSFLLLNNIWSLHAEAHPDAIGENGLATLEAYHKDLVYLKQKVTPTPLSLFVLHSHF